MDIVAEPFPQPSMVVSKVGLRGSYVNLITADNDKIHLPKRWLWVGIYSDGNHSVRVDWVAKY